MDVKIKVKGLEYVYNELKKVNALAREIENRLDNIKFYCSSVGVEIAEYGIAPLDSKSPEELINNAVDRVETTDFSVNKEIK